MLTKMILSSKTLSKQDKEDFINAKYEAIAAALTMLVMGGVTFGFVLMYHGCKHLAGLN